ncbi:MAG TPA: glycosyl hydrolase family 8 [Fibrobacteraceae bacterium]|nr:glycosyl hydrolase family 8 [Fibrobacteraceae bacterium]
MKFYAFAIFAIAATTVVASPKFPYPQEGSYPYGINATDPQSSALKTKFTKWYSNYYSESGNYARIKFDDTTYTVSEGIGYGMLILVYFSDASDDYQSQFNKLWAYYQAHENGNGVMNWKIQGFNSTVGENGATDAEEDVALALIMAYYQWGDATYLSAAKTLIAAIRNNEVDGSYIMKPGDAWDSYKNPGYSAPAAYELFKTVDDGNSSFWSSVITANYSLYAANSYSSTGLISDWCDNSGNAVQGNSAVSGVFYYDASRGPWRLATAYSWFGHSSAKSENDALASWVKSNMTVYKIKAGYYQSGTVYESGYSTPAFIGPFGCSMMSNSNNQGYLDSAYDRILDFTYKISDYTSSNYFHSCMQLLTGLLMSGNMPNFAEATPTSSKAISSSAISSSSQVSSSSVKASSSSATSSASVSSSAVNSSVSSSGSVSVGDYGACIEFVNGVGDYSEHCYNSGLMNMDDGVCYIENTERTEDPDWINADASDGYWWTEVDCASDAIHSLRAIYGFSWRLNNQQLSLTLPSQETVTVQVHDMLGRLEARPFQGELSAGVNTLNLGPLSTGMHIVTVRTRRGNSARMARIY